MTQSSLRSTLETIFSADPIDSPIGIYVVPKQGNWFNPQDSILNPDKPKTWIAFLMRDALPRSTSIYLKNPTDEEDPPLSMVPNISYVELQFVGTMAEALAQSVQHWLHMPLVADTFGADNAQVMAQDLGKYNVSNFYQDGENTVLAYNTTVGIQWANVLASTQDQLISAEMGGTVEEVS
jgi:hypothetical protein